MCLPDSAGRTLTFARLVLELLPKIKAFAQERHEVTKALCVLQYFSHTVPPLRPSPFLLSLERVEGEVVVSFANLAERFTKSILPL